MFVDSPSFRCHANLEAQQQELKTDATRVTHSNSQAICSFKVTQASRPTSSCFHVACAIRVVSKLTKALPYFRAKGETSHENFGLIAFPGCEDEAYELKYVALDLDAMQDYDCCDIAYTHAAGTF